MLNTPILDIIISIVFIYFSFSLLNSLIVEFISSIIQSRGKLLKDAINKILADKSVDSTVKSNKQPSDANADKSVDLADQFYKHPLVANLKRKEGRLPAYISSQIFATTLIDILSTLEKESSTNESSTLDYSFENLKEKVIFLENTDTAKWLRSFLRNSKDIEDLRSNLQSWYDMYMDRVTGWYKIRLKKTLVIVAIPLVLFFNVDSIKIIENVTKDHELRVSLVQAGISTIEQDNKGKLNPPKDVVKSATQIDSLITGLEELRLPIGWNIKSLRDVNWDSIKANLPKTFMGYVFLLLGWTISVLAISVGAPFWFDALGYLVNMRGAGVKPKVNSSELNIDK